VTWKGWENFDPTGQPAADAPKAHKYHAKAVVVDGFRFASKREAARWRELKALEHAGMIRSLDRQVRMPLHAAGGALVGHYVCDFQYWDVEKNLGVVEDAKGFKTDTYRWKKRHVKAEYNIDIQEV